MADIEDIYELSPMQQGMLFHTLADPTSTDYVEQFQCQLRGDLDPALLRRAWQETLERQTVLRSGFHWEGLEKALQVVQRGLSLPWQPLDWSRSQDLEGQYQAFLLADRQQGLALEQAPLMRLHLLDCADHWRLVWTFHHILLDGWCAALVLQEVLERYLAHRQGRPPRLLVSRPYRDYILWLQARPKDQAEAFWREHLAGFDAPTPLPANLEAAAATSPGEIPVAMDPTLESTLAAFCRAQRITLASLLQGAWAMLLARHSGEQRVLFGTTVAGRPTELPGVETMVGLFINTLPVAISLDWHKPLGAWLRELQAIQAERDSHAYTPLVDIQGYSAIAAGTALFDSLLVVENLPTLGGEEEPLPLRVDQPRLTERSHYPLTFMANPGERLDLRLKYDGKRCRAATVARLAEQLGTLLAAMVQDPERAIGRLSLLSGTERQRLLVALNTTAVNHPAAPCLHQLFEAQVDRSPGASALQWEDQRWDYRQLDGLANALAGELRQRGVGPERVVGVQLPRSPAMVVSLLAILKAGGAYLPIDPEAPQARRDWLLANAGSGLLLCESGTAHDLPAGVQAIHPGLDATQTERPGVADLGPGNLAYVLYTSGSTGEPKGVMVEHRAVVNHMYWTQSWYPLSPEDRVLQKTPYTFDASLCDLFTPLLNGALLVLARPGGHQDGEYLVDRVQQHGITVLQLVPSLLRLLLATPGIQRCRSLRMLFCGGETLEPALVQACLGTLPVSLHNVYGPTEATIHAAGHTAQAQDQRIAIGKPIDNCRLYIVDGDLNPLPVGAPGELCIGGLNLARGYSQRPGLTAEAFIPDPFSGEPGARLYRSGDRCRFLPDGTIEYLGRLDRQLKFRGQRLEPGEIEGILNAHPWVRESAVSLFREPGGADSLLAHVSGDPTPDPATLADHLRQHLPGGLIPTRWVILPSLPKLSSGKVDRRRLPPPAMECPRQESATPPRSPRERTLVAIWREVLKLPAVGINDNFFELGGDSILSLQVASRCRQAGLAVNPGQLFAHPTVAALAEAVATANSTPVAEQRPISGTVDLIPIQRGFFTRRPPVPQHYNQSLRLELGRDTDPRQLETALNRLLIHHDALRLRFTPGEAGWEQWNAPPGQTLTLEQYPLDGITGEAREARIQAVAGELQAGLDLMEGPLTRAAWFPGDDAYPDQLLLVIHHLAVDGVSWRILLEDLQSLYRGEALPAKTTAFRDWSASLQRWASDPGLLAESAFWEGQKLTQVPERLRPAAGENTEAHTASLERMVDAATTQRLLQALPARGRFQVEEALLSALALALASWSDSTTVGLNLEGHGRQSPDPTMDPSRTVGWFTCRYPIRLDGPPPDDQPDTVRQWLETTRERRRAVPHGGLGYGVLRYLSQHGEALAAGPWPTVSFNYLGRFQEEDQHSGWRISDADSGPEHSPENPRSHALGVDMLVLGDRLRILANYHRKQHPQVLMEALLDGFLHWLPRVLEVALDRDSPWSPADFPLAGLDTETLARVLGASPPTADLYPLSPMQQGLLFHSLQNPSAGAYVEQLVVELGPALDTQALRQTWDWLLQRHPTLRTACRWQGLERALAWVAEAPAIPWREEDWQDCGPAVREERLTHYLESDRLRGFAMDQAPLMRFLLAHHPSGWTLVWTHHHLLLDGWCMPRLLEELEAGYGAFSRGGEPRLAEPPRYRDYIQWLETQDPAATRSFWQAELAGIHEPTLLPLSPATGQPRPITVEKHLSGPGRQALEALCRRLGITLASALQGAWAILLGRHGGGDRVVFGLTVAGRPASLPHAEQMMGVFINTLPVVVHLDRRPLGDWLQELHRQQGAREAHGHTPLAQIQGWSALPPGSALFEALLVIENYPPGAGGDPLLPVRAVRLLEETHYPLNLLVIPEGEGLLLRLQADAGRLTVSATQLLEHLESLLERLPTLSDCPVQDLPFLDERWRQRLLQQWNDTQRQHPGSALLPDWLEAQAARSAEATALVWADGELSYAALHRRANRLAHRLRREGVGPECRVGVCLPRSVDLLVALLAIHKAGGAYLPLEPDLPDVRLAWLAGDGAVRLILSHGDLLARLPSQVPHLALDREDLSSEPTTPPPRRLHPENLAYVIYTSGSTGKPKGVMVSHRAVCNHMAWIQRIFPLGPDDRVLQRTPLGFDPSVVDLFGPLLHGARLILARPDGHRDGEHLTALIRQQSISHAVTTPSVLGILANTPGFQNCPTLRHVIAVGEALPPAVAERCLQTIPGLALHNCYGPTEATIHVSHWTVPEGFQQILIGRPADNTRLHLLDAHGQPVPVGVAGELCIGGMQLARGYLNRPGLTAERFAPDPLGLEPGGRLYRTGDLARYTAEGDIEYLGRRDAQLKVNGVRLEPAEVEAVLAEHPAVRACGVCGQGKPVRLVAHLLFRDGPVPEGELRRFLAERLPGPMIPARFIAQPQLPFLVSGKLDRKALLALPVETPIARPREPVNPLEARLLEAWRAVLGDLGVEDDFFAHGGDSFRAVQLAARLEEDGVAVDLPTLYRHPTARDLARLLDSTTETRLHPLVDVGANPGTRLICFPPLLGHGLVFRELARKLEGVAVYGLDFPGTETDPAGWLGDLLVSQLGTATPCWLLGYSAGGTLAWDCAMGLAERGMPIAGLILLDASRWPGGLQADGARREALMNRAFDMLGAGLAGELPGEKGIRRRMNAYLDYLSREPSIGSQEIPLHLILAEQPTASGEALAAQWRALTRAEFSVYQGRGDHYSMLRSAPAIQHNTRLIGQILIT